MPDNTDRPNMEIGAESAVERMLKRREEEQKQREIIIENEAEWKDAANSLFASPNGKLLAKYLLRYCNVFSIDSTSNNVMMIENNGKRKVYLELIRPFLTAEVRSFIENQ